MGDHSQMLTLRVLIYVKAKQRLGSEMESGIFDTNCSCSEKTWQKFRFTMLFYIVGYPTIYPHQRSTSWKIYGSFEGSLLKTKKQASS